MREDDTVEDDKRVVESVPQKSAHDSAMWQFYTALCNVRSVPFLLFLSTDTYLMRADVDSRKHAAAQNINQHIRSAYLCLS